jgi:hypothetical protein
MSRLEHKGHITVEKRFMPYPATGPAREQYRYKITTDGIIAAHFPS